MAFTYSGDPSSSSKDEVRFLLGDTDCKDEQLSDSEVSYLLAEYPSARLAAARGARALAAKYTRQVSYTSGGVRRELSDRARAYNDLAAQLEADTGVGAYVGGTSESEKDAFRSDSDLVQPNFSVGMQDNETDTSSADRRCS